MAALHAPPVTGALQIETVMPVVDVEGRLRSVYRCEIDDFWKAQVLSATSIGGYQVNVYRIELIKFRSLIEGASPRRLLGIPWP